MQRETLQLSFQSIARLAFHSALLLVLLLAVLPAPELPGPGFSDKIAHCLCFVLLAFLFCLGYSKRQLSAEAFAGLVGYGLLIEVVQYFLAWRSFSLADLGADTTGLLLFCVAAAGWQHV